MGCCTPKTKKYVVFGVGGFLIAVGFVIGGVWNIIYEYVLQMNLALAPGSTSYNLWADLKIPMYLDIYMFDFVNAEEYFTSLEAGTPIKPKFEQRGPYIFKEHHLRSNIHWNDNNTITFQQIRTWNFVPSLSNGQLSDKVTFINPIPITAVTLVDKMNEILKIIFNSLMNKLEKHHLYTTQTVENALFKGYDDKLLDLIKAANYSIDMPFDRFAWFAQRNNSATYDGTFTMYTGHDDISKLGLLTSWNYVNSTDFYTPNTECSKIEGTTGELWPAPKESHEPVKIFIPDICTYFTLNYSQEMIKNDVTGYRYIAPKSNLATSGDHECYCAEVDPCQPDGTMDISKCKFNAPVFVSFPHFYLADESYLEPLDGLNPNKELHEFNVGLEPETGIPLEAHGRLQINLKLQKYTSFDMFKYLPDEIYMPSFWFTQRAAIDEDMSSMLRLLVLLPTIGQATFFGIGGIGVLIVIIGIVITLRRGWGENKTDILIH